MELDWGALSRIDTIFGILGGIVVLFSGLRWSMKTIKSSRFHQTFSWAVTGDSNQDVLKVTFVNASKWVFAILLWAIIGSIIGVMVVLLLTGIVIGLGSTVSGVSGGIRDFAIIGASVGVLARIILLPSYKFISRVLKRREGASNQIVLSENSLLIYPHRSPPYNAAKILYVGSEMAINLDVKISYVDLNGQQQTKQITDFFPDGDSNMIWYHYKYDFLKPDQVAYFRLVNGKSTADRKATITVDFVGAKSQIPIHIEKEFELEDF